MEALMSSTEPSDFPAVHDDVHEASAIKNTNVAELTSQTVRAEAKNQEKPATKAGYVAIIGQPNVGKSTLLNAILHFKLSIVSPKPQTTQKRILGIANRPNSQIIFFDTPGVCEVSQPRSGAQHAAGRLLLNAMMRAVYQAMREADVQLFLSEPTSTPQPTDLEIINRMVDTAKPIVLAINKIDTVPKDNLLPLIEAFHAQHKVQEIVPISALRHDGIEQLLVVLEKYLPVHEPFYDTDLITNHPERFLAAEIIREKIFLRYAEEIPYSATVQVEEFIERPGHKDYIRAVIYVERPSQKGILIGKGGQALKQVGKLAREEMEMSFGRPIYLDLFVTVKEKWRDREEELRRLGYL
ncbi:MAG: GTPase Era [candidate division KSB1 bacterium]|nr:GTPase Era [candidate division KSB1 bacterium]